MGTLHLGLSQTKSATSVPSSIRTNPQKHGIHPKLRVGAVNDPEEAHADRVADRIMRMPEADVSGLPPAAPSASVGSILRRTCASCAAEDERLHRKETPSASTAGGTVSAPVESAIRNLGPGTPLPTSERAFFEPRFGENLGHVRIHNTPAAHAASQSINARAFALGNAVAFAPGEYSPGTAGGRSLMAHELAHVNGVHTTRTGGSTRVDPQQEEIHRWPGDGLAPPGDCSWVEYGVLRASVETAKAVVSTLGGCSPGDSCLFLATKIAAIGAEIAARVALDATCFKGGDTGHRQQIQDKINMLNRCYRFFSGSNCSPELIAAMAIVVEQARAAIAAAAIVVALAAIAALVAALIALMEFIAAAAVAAAAALAGTAEAAAIGTAAAALVLFISELSETLGSAPEDKA